MKTKAERVFLFCGILLGPLFYGLVGIQMLTREGVDIRRHPLSMLSLGHDGWMQIANFITTGSLAIACALGIRRCIKTGIGRTSGPMLIAAFGVGMIIAGLFSADPAFGFPPGTPDTIPTELSGSAKVHGLGFFLAFASLTVSCFVFARRFRALASPNWSLYSTATGMAIPVVIALGVAVPSAASLSFAFVGIIAFGWLAVIAAGLSAEHRG